MKINKAAFVDKYVLENEDIIKKINDDILYLEKFPDDKNIINEIMRSFHTIKGTSRMMGFSEMSDLAHKSEDFLSGITRGGISVDELKIDFLIKLSDVMKSKLQSIKKGDEISISDMLEQLSEIIEKELFESITSFEFPVFEKAEEKKNEIRIDKSKFESEFVKIKTDRLDVILKDVNEVMIHYLNVKNTTDRLLTTLQTIKSEANDEGEGDELYQKFLTIYKGYREHLGKMEIYISQIQGALFDLKMLPLNIVFDQLPKAARDIARQLKKRVEVVIESENSYLDKSIIEKFDEPIIHLLRNAIAHGIESPAERRTLRKNEIGKIVIKSYMESGNVIINIKDDGKGIDTGAIKKNAIKKGIISEGDLSLYSEEDIINLIFSSDISTTEAVDDISGRGVGMAIIKKSIEDLKGSITIKTVKSKGTEFTILLPLTLSTISVLFINCNDIIFAIPLSYIDEIVHVKNSDIIDMSNRKVLRHRDVLIRLTELDSILPMGEMKNKDYNYIIIFKSLDMRLGVYINDIINESEIVIKPLPTHLKKVRTVVGITINNINEISNILHIPYIIEHSLREKKGNIISSGTVKNKQKKSVLIVDDAKSVRDILSNIIKDYDYIIEEAEHGREALEKLETAFFDIVLSDIKMPVMDGLSLLKSIKQNNKLKDIPVVMISSLQDKETIEKARKLGASKYIVKDKFKALTLVKVMDDLTV